MCQSKGYKKGNRILSYYARLSLVNFFEPIPPYKRKPFFQEDLLNPSTTFYLSMPKYRYSRLCIVLLYIKDDVK